MTSAFLWFAVVVLFVFCSNSAAEEVSCLGAHCVSYGGSFVMGHWDSEYQQQCGWEERVSTARADIDFVTHEAECKIDRISFIYNEETHAYENADAIIELFRQQYENKAPVILSRGVSSRNRGIIHHSCKNALLDRFGDQEIILSTANTHSYRKERMDLEQYISQFMTNQSYFTLDNTGASSFYHFGDNDYDAWEDLFDLYHPPLEILSTDSPSTYSYGLGTSGSGVPFHKHGPVFAEVLHGAKRWFLAKPDVELDFDPDGTSLRWLHAELQKNPQHRSKDIYDCICYIGDVLYIPDSWWHSTLNIGDAVFISTFFFA
eukprot:TRINITY_DN6636_c0_g1_i1.p1 TRINITY_DN6636_c0_g1~~TRINITY_DN6636_c0_g1_i1.p1  ORF type:complete len:318 (+),score=32.49 TRINITY_DN6636_c0_g1_i1:37-990(+)